jgi:hypothetical protein
MPSWITQVGAGGAFLLIALNMILKFMDKQKAKKNGNLGNPTNSTGKIIGMLQELKIIVDNQTKILDKIYEKILER